MYSKNSPMSQINGFATTGMSRVLIIFKIPATTTTRRSPTGRSFLWKQMTIPPLVKMMTVLNRAMMIVTYQLTNCDDFPVSFCKCGSPGLVTRVPYCSLALSGLCAWCPNASTARIFLIQDLFSTAPQVTVASWWLLTCVPAPRGLNTFAHVKRYV